MGHAGRIRRSRRHPAFIERLILTQHLVPVLQQRVGHFAHHPAFRGKAVPVKHPALQQTSVKLINSPLSSSFSICR